jgi:hypothetical protein
MNFFIRLAQLSYSRLCHTDAGDSAPQHPRRWRADYFNGARKTVNDRGYSPESSCFSLGQALIRYWNMDHNVSTAARYSSTSPTS